jgi:hypothetical protein
MNGIPSGELRVMKSSRRCLIFKFVKRSILKIPGGSKIFFFEDVYSSSVEDVCGVRRESVRQRMSSFFAEAINYLLTNPYNRQQSHPRKWAKSMKND